MLDNFIFVSQRILNRGTRTYGKVHEASSTPIHIDGVKMMLELNQKHVDMEQCNLQATMLRMVHNDGKCLDRPPNSSISSYS